MNKPIRVRGLILLLVLLVCYCLMIWTVYSVHGVDAESLVVPVVFGVLLFLCSTMLLIKPISYSGFLKQKKNRVAVSSVSATIAGMVVVAIFVMPFTKEFSFEIVFCSKYSLVIFLALFALIHPLIRKKIQ